MEESVIEYVINKSESPTKFICLPDRLADNIEDPAGKSLLINYSGKKALFDNKIFKPEYFVVNVESEESLSHLFGPVQIKVYKDHIDALASKQKKLSSDDCVDGWSANRLMFYKKRIAPLKSGEKFEVEVVSEGTYVMSKEDFENIFDNVVKSYSYLELGVYSYSKTPKKAEEFLRSK
jgi:hypothetical protein